MHIVILSAAKNLLRFITFIMKRVISILILSSLVSLSLSAQPSRVAKPLPRSQTRYGRQYDRTSPGRYRGGRYSQGYFAEYYFGLAAGLTVSSIHSNSSALDGHSAQTGAFIGVTGGYQIMPYVPLYLESGLLFVEKGGKSSFGNSDFTYDLNYLELPVVARYKIFLLNGCTVQPFFGFYLAEGVGGKIRNYQDRVAYGSFGNTYPDNFRRFDSGLRLGCSLNFMFLHVQAAYDAGLVNIGQDDFDDTRNGCFMLSFGFNF